MIYGFSKAQEDNIQVVLSKLADRRLLTGLETRFSSGGGYYHFLVQMTNNRWIGFHSVEGDVTISRRYKTVKGVERGMWFNCGVGVTSVIPTNYKASRTFKHTDVIVEDIINENYTTIQF